MAVKARVSWGRAYDEEVRSRRYMSGGGSSLAALGVACMSSGKLSKARKKVLTIADSSSALRLRSVGESYLYMAVGRLDHTAAAQCFKSKNKFVPA